mmetsp:Transcript_39429/g.58021  ORF Transcript_39429/g.58021 Transcript_39429/m.58021 type:complete len:203 (+) Transcript_39429:1631-2239(+)
MPANPLHGVATTTRRPFATSDSIKTPYAWRGSVPTKAPPIKWTRPEKRWPSIGFLRSFGRHTSQPAMRSHSTLGFVPFCRSPPRCSLCTFAETSPRVLSEEEVLPSASLAARVPDSRAPDFLKDSHFSLSYQSSSSAAIPPCMRVPNTEAATDLVWRKLRRHIPEEDQRALPRAAERPPGVLTKHVDADASARRSAIDKSAP